MDRRNFLKMLSVGAMSFFLSGCGLTAAADERNLPKKNISGGKKMKIVVINSSPHSEKESTSKFLAKKFFSKISQQSKSVLKNKKWRSDAKYNFY